MIYYSVALAAGSRYLYPGLVPRIEYLMDIQSRVQFCPLKKIFKFIGGTYDNYLNIFYSYISFLGSFFWMAGPRP